MTNLARQNTVSPGTVPAHALKGEPVKGGMGVHQTGQGNIQPAGLHSQAPYKPPKRRRRDNPGKLLCSVEGCRGYPMKEIPYCTGHARSKGLIKSWDIHGRKKGNDGDADGDS